MVAVFIGFAGHILFGLVILGIGLYVANLVADYGERFERDIALPEQQLYQDEIEAFRAAADHDADGDPENDVVEQRAAALTGEPFAAPALRLRAWKTRVSTSTPASRTRHGARTRP